MRWTYTISSIGWLCFGMHSTKLRQQLCSDDDYIAKNETAHTTATDKRTQTTKKYNCFETNNYKQTHTNQCLGYLQLTGSKATTQTDTNQWKLPTDKQINSLESFDFFSSFSFCSTLPGRECHDRCSLSGTLQMELFCKHFSFKIMAK